eukprot:2060855-Pyramimonas_sp.AAC.1
MFAISSSSSSPPLCPLLTTPYPCHSRYSDSFTCCLISRLQCCISRALALALFSQGVPQMLGARPARARGAEPGGAPLPRGTGEPGSLEKGFADRATTPLS